MNRRAERLASIIRRELADIILHELDDPRLTGMPSVTRVELVEDLSIANVYVTIMGTPGQQTAALNALKHSAGLMRTRLTKEMSIRQVPFLQFHIDEQLKKELAVLELIDKVARENAELDRKRIEAAGEAQPGSPGSGDGSPSGPSHTEAGGIAEAALPAQGSPSAGETNQEQP